MSHLELAAILLGLEYKPPCLVLCPACFKAVSDEAAILTKHVTGMNPGLAIYNAPGGVELKVFLAPGSLVVTP
jgi:hypothetical protein